MAVSKRLRFEVFRRDNFQCRYCGAKPPQVELRADHVMPEALGGRTEPSNLVTACEPCNSGKTSIAPDSALVDDVQQDAARWALAIKAAAELRAQEHEERQRYADHFLMQWCDWTHGSDRNMVPLPDDWETTLYGFHDRGLPHPEIPVAIKIAMTNDRVSPEATFKYFCGILWNVLRDMHEIAAAAATKLAAEDEAKPGTGS